MVAGNSSLALYQNLWNRRSQEGRRREKGKRIGRKEKEEGVNITRRRRQDLQDEAGAEEDYLLYCGIIGLRTQSEGHRQNHGEEVCLWGDCG